LKAALLKEAAKQGIPAVEVTEETPVEVPAVESEISETPEQDEPVPPAASKRGLWRKEIDLGDGSGKQVFEAATKDELIDALVKAQENATRKIRELNRRVKSSVQPEAAKPAAKFEPQTLSVDEQFALSQELQTNPTGAVSKLFKATVGATPEEIREALQAAREAGEARKAQAEATTFLNSHSEYVNNNSNEKAMMEYLHKNNMAITATNLEIAFEDLLEAGLVSTKSETPQPPTVQKPTTTVRKRVTVGLPARTSSAEVPDANEPHEPTADEFRKLSQEERRRIVLRSVRR
jgi:hypothetical protein